MLSHRQLFLNHVAQTSETPLLLEIEKAEGIYLFGTDGKKYIDLISGIGVSNIGHRHPKVVQAIKDQVDKYMHVMVYGEFIQSPQTLLAKKILETLPSFFENVYFVNSGSEALEGALKLAKRYTGRSEIISFHNGYHGSTHGALSVNGNEKIKQAFRPLLPDIRHIRLNEMEDLKFISKKTACVIIEPIQGEAGVRIANHDYLITLAAHCKSTGTLLIVDEIQTGFGRTGKFWSFEHYGITPDIVLCAKGMGGGMPIGAFISSKNIMSCLMNDPILGHITTFGGHPVSCAASLAIIDVIFEETLLEKVDKKEALFKQLLIHPKIKSVRSKGLLIAVEFDSFDVLKPIIDKSIEKGVVTDWFLYCNDSMRIAPPLNISHQEIVQSCEIILSSL